MANNTIILPPIHKSITYKLLKIVFGLYVIITLLTTCFYLWAEFRHEKQDLVIEIDLLIDTVEFSLSDAVENNDGPQINTVLRGMINNRRILGVEFSYLDTKNDYKVWDFSGEHKSSSKVYQRAFAVRRFVDGKVDIDNKIVAKGMVYADYTFIVNKIKFNFIHICISAAIKSFMLWVLFLWAGKKYLSEPLALFIKNIKDLDVDDLSNINVIAESASDELMVLQSAFNSMIVMTKDYVEQIKAFQHKLYLSESYLKDIFNSMPSLLLTIDVDQKVVYANHKVCKYLRSQESDVVNKALGEVMHKLNIGSEFICEAINNNRHDLKDKIKVMQDNQEKYFSLVIYPLRLSNMGFVIRLEDISERVMMEAMMVQNEKLSSLGTLAAGMAHEINNPLGGILQSMQNIERRLDPNLPANIQAAQQCGISLTNLQCYFNIRKLDQFINGINQMGQRAASIVSNVLKFSRMSDSKIEEVAVRQLVNAVVDMALTDYGVKKQENLKNLNITVNISDEVDVIECIPSEMQQVLLNLVGNSLYALTLSNKAEPEIAICVELCSDAVALVVKDNGVGIAESDINKLFEPFFTTKPPGIGTGLGLSIAYNIIVEKHKGKLEVSSKEGVGTTFKILLPR